MVDQKRKAPAFVYILLSIFVVAMTMVITVSFVSIAHQRAQIEAVIRNTTFVSDAAQDYYSRYHTVPSRDELSAFLFTFARQREVDINDYGNPYGGGPFILLEDTEEGPTLLPGHGPVQSIQERLLAAEGHCGYHRFGDRYCVQGYGPRGVITQTFLGP